MTLCLNNKFGAIHIGTIVVFEPENPNIWLGSMKGILEHNGEEFVIRTKDGTVTINKGYDAYLNSVRPVINKWVVAI